MFAAHGERCHIYGIVVRIVIISGLTINLTFGDQGTDRITRIIGKVPESAAAVYVCGSVHIDISVGFLRFDVHGRILCDHDITGGVGVVVGVADFEGEHVWRRVETVAGDVVVHRMVNGERTAFVIVGDPVVVARSGGIVRIAVVHVVVIVHRFKVQFSVVRRGDDCVEPGGVVHVVAVRRGADVAGILDFSIGLHYGLGVPGHHVVLPCYLQHRLEVVAAEDGHIQFDMIPGIGIHTQSRAGHLVVELLLSGLLALLVQVCPGHHQLDEGFALVAVVPALRIRVERGAVVPSVAVAVGERTLIVAV